MRSFAFRLCDVFSDRPLAGNALAVFTDASGLEASEMQALAREMNLSESAFVLTPTDPTAHARLRIFTPTMELPFAGHPTLGSAFVLADPLAGERLLRLETARGVSEVRLSKAPGSAGFGWMTQPIPHVRLYPHAAELLTALGLERASLPIELYDNGPRYVLVEVDDAARLGSLTPDFTRLAALGSIAATVYARRPHGVKTRVFAPGEGIPEDPATGAAAGPTALHMARHGRIRFGEQISIEQGVEVGRPSRLEARVFGAVDHVERVEVGGSAVVIGRGEIELPAKAAVGS